MGQSRAPVRRSQDEVIGSLRSALERIMYGAAEAAGRSRRAAGITVRLYKLQNRLVRTQYLETDDHAHFRAIFREAEVRAEQRIEDVANSRRWSVMFKAWNEALVEAAERLHERRPVPFHQYLDEDDLAIMAEDREADFGARGISEAWQS